MMAKQASEVGVCRSLEHDILWLSLCMHAYLAVPSFEGPLAYEKTSCACPCRLREVSGEQRTSAETWS